MTKEREKLMNKLSLEHIRTTLTNNANQGSYLEGFKAADAHPIGRLKKVLDALETIAHRCEFYTCPTEREDVIQHCLDVSTAALDDCNASQAKGGE